MSVSLHFFLFMLCTILECVTLFILMFTMFKIPIKVNVIHILFASTVISYFVFSINEVDNIANYSIILQIIVLFLFVWLMFRIQIFYAFVISCVSFITYTLVQILIFYTLRIWGIVDMSTLNEEGYAIFLLQLSSVSFTLAICSYLRNKGIGFNYVPHSEDAKVKLTKTNITLLSTVIIASFIYQSLYVIARKESLSSGGIAWLIINSISVVILTYYSIKKDNEEW